MKAIQSFGVVCTLLWSVACASVGASIADSTGGAGGGAEVAASGGPSIAGAAAAYATPGAGAGGDSGTAAMASQAGEGGEAGAAGEPGAAPHILTGFNVAEDSWFADTTLFQPMGKTPNQFVAHDPYARVSVTTGDDEMDVEAVTVNPSGTAGDSTFLSNGTAPGDNDLADIGVFVDGVFNQSIVFSAPTYTKTRQTINLPPGKNKIVDFVERAHLTGLGGTFAVNPIGPAHGRRMVVYGDSIPAGFRAALGNVGSFYNGWPMLARYAGRFGLTNYSISGDELWAGLYNLGAGILANGIEIQAKRLAAKAADGTTQRSIWLELGTNDWGLNHVTVAEFGATETTLIADVHAIDPSITFYLQTPIKRTNEGPNKFGDTLSDFRAEEATIQATCPTYCTLVDGTVFDVGALADGVHPTALGHQGIAAGALMILQ